MQEKSCQNNFEQKKNGATVKFVCQINNFCFCKCHFKDITNDNNLIIISRITVVDVVNDYVVFCNRLNLAQTN